MPSLPPAPVPFPVPTLDSLPKFNPPELSADVEDKLWAILPPEFQKLREKRAPSKPHGALLEPHGYPSAITEPEVLVGPFIPENPALAGNSLAGLGGSFAVEGPAEVFRGEDFYDGSDRPLVENFEKPLVRRSEISQFEDKIGEKEYWQDRDFY